MNTIKQNLSRLRGNRSSNEDGMTLVEIMIASVIIVIILIATAAGFTSAFNASASSENQNKATQMIADTMAIADQASFSKLGLATPAAGDTTGCSTWTTTYQTEAMVVTTTPYTGLVYCQPKKYSNVGITFYIETRITYLSTTSYDGSSQSNTITGQHYNPKRITVTVRWTEKVDTDNTPIVSSVSMTNVRVPSVNECIPPGLNAGSVQPGGCN